LSLSSLSRGAQLSLQQLFSIAPVKLFSAGEHALSDWQCVLSKTAALPCKKMHTQRNMLHKTSLIFVVLFTQFLKTQPFFS
jgi:hypothetical protein